MTNIVFYNSNQLSTVSIFADNSNGTILDKYQTFQHIELLMLPTNHHTTLNALPKA